LKSVVAGDEAGITAEAVAEMACALEFPVIEEFVGQESWWMTGRDPRAEVGRRRPSLTGGLGLPSVKEQPASRQKTFGLQFLLDPLRQAPMKTESATGGR